MRGERKPRRAHFLPPHSPDTWHSFHFSEHNIPLLFRSLLFCLLYAFSSLSSCLNVIHHSDLSSSQKNPITSQTNLGPLVNLLIAHDTFVPFMIIIADLLWDHLLMTRHPCQNGCCSSEELNAQSSVWHIRGGSISTVK